MTAANPRIQEARLRAAGVKRALLVVSVAGFLAAFVLARAGHPGQSTAAQPAAPSVAPVQSDSSDDEGASFDFGSASVAPAQSTAPTQSQNVAPSVQTSTS